LQATRKVLFLAFVLVATAFFAALAVRDYAAYWYASAESLEGFKAATRLQPENAEYWRAQGAYQLFSSPDFKTAVQSAVRAAELNPWSARTWLLLATIHQVSDQPSAQEKALVSAINADPRTPDVAWEVANFFLIRGETARALPLFRPVVENDPKRAAAAFRLCWRATHDLNAILSETTPPTTAAHLQLLGVLTEHNEKDAASQVWSNVVQMNQPVERSEAYSYFDFLIGQNEIEKAHRVSEDIQRLNGEADARREGNLIVNGDFEQRITNRGFDWRYTKVTGAKLTIDYSERRSGTQSLMVHFDGHPGELGLAQYVLVTPGAHYEVSASVKWQDIATSSGPRLALVDAHTGQQYAATQDLLESGVWREISTGFTAPPNTRLVIVKLLRTPGYPVIKGDLWVDDVRMVKR
jgi:hypothetical protein